MLGLAYVHKTFGSFTFDRNQSGKRVPNPSRSFFKPFARFVLAERVEQILD